MVMSCYGGRAWMLVEAKEDEATLPFEVKGDDVKYSTAL